ncbi:hypothetical protein [Mycolicibacterium sp.]|uniref:hypothetical protein n=1 Tax=Mycolicibacterium sp. TaxID=2320850 RepID=UPI0028A6229A|nr:hypothetical protein [Mycolicibacterium sp.]
MQPLGDRGKSLVDQVFDAARKGVALEIASERPNLSLEGNTVPASIIHDALAGEVIPLHRRGLTLRGLFIAGDVDLSYLQWHGQLSLLNCRIDGEIVLDHSKPMGEVRFDGSCTKRVSARSAAIDGNFFMRDGFCSKEGIYAIGLRVSNSFSLRRSQICGPEDMSTRMAIEIFRGNFGDVFFQNSDIRGGVYAAGITVERNFRIQGSKIRSRSAMGWRHTGVEFKGAITLAGSEVKGSIYLSTESTKSPNLVDGPISLSSASCRQLFVHEELLDRSTIDLDGLTYKRLRGVNVESLLKHLNSQENIQRQAYVILSEYARSVGNPAASRNIMFDLERRTTSKLPIWSRQRMTRAIYGASVGYGYRVYLSVPWLGATIVLAAVVIHSGKRFMFPKNEALNGRFVDNRPDWHESFTVTLDNFLPFASMGVRDSWAVHITTLEQWPYLALFLMLKFFAWGLAALALVSFTSSARK